MTYVNGTRPILPSQVSARTGRFDQFATSASEVVSRAVFFASCVAMVVVWVPTYFLLRDVDTWQLVINTATTIVTFLLVALLQNSATRADRAAQHKLNAVALGLAELIEATCAQLPEEAAGRPQLVEARRELVAAVGLEQRENS